MIGARDRLTAEELMLEPGVQPGRSGRIERTGPTTRGGGEPRKQGMLGRRRR